MNYKYYKFLFIALFLLINNQLALAQETRYKYGFVFGTGEQGIFPFSDDDYVYETTFFKGQINYTFKRTAHFSFEINLEPSFYSSKHQLLNKYFITPENYENYVEEREIMTRRKTIKEYVLNIGVISRYHLNNKISIYALGSVGPMIIDTRTERMAKGFAFSDIFSLGVSHKFAKLILDFRYGIRHVSNLELKNPNSGYNSTNFEIGFLYDF